MTPQNETGASKFYRRIICPAAVISVVMIFLMACVAELTAVEADFKPAVSLRGVAVIILFSIVFAVCNLLLDNKSMPLGGRIFMHFMSVTADFVIVFIILGGYGSSGSSAAAVTGIFAAAYLIIAAVILLIRALVKRAKVDNSEYKRQFR